MSNQFSENLDSSQVSLYAHVYDKRIEFKNLHNQSSIWDEILRLNQETGGSWTHEQAIQLALHPQLDLDPDPMLRRDQATNDTFVKPTHRKLKKKKRKLNSYEVELEDAKRVKLEKMMFMMDDRVGKEFIPKYNQIKYFRKQESEVTETNQHLADNKEYPLYTLVYIYRDNNDKYEVIVHAVKGNDMQEHGDHTSSLCSRYLSKLDDNYETFVKSFVVLYMMNNKLLDDSERSNKIYAEKIVRLAEEYSQESNQNELFNNHSIDKSEPYQILELLTKQSTPEIKSSTFEYTNEDGTKAEITSISDLYTAAVIKRHAEESSPVIKQQQMVAQGSTPMQISQNPQSIQPPQTRPQIPNRPIVQMTSPQPPMQGMIRLPNQQMPAQPQTPNQMPINVQMPTQQAVQITSPMVIHQPRQGITTNQVVQPSNPGKIPPPKMVMQLQQTMSPQPSRQPPNQNPVIVPAQQNQISAQKNPIKVSNQIQSTSQSTPGTPLQLQEQTQVHPVQRSPRTPMKSPAPPSRTSAPSTPMPSAEQVQITQPSQRSAPNTPMQSPGQIPGQSPIVITPRPVTSQHPIHNEIQLASAQNTPQPNQNITLSNGRVIPYHQYLVLLRRHQQAAQAQLSGQIRGQVPNQLVNQVTNPTVIQRRFTPQVQVGNSQQQVDMMMATQQQIIGNNQSVMVQQQFPINQQQLQGVISEQTPQLQLNIPQMVLYRAMRPNVVQRQQVTQQQMTLNTQPFVQNNNQWIFPQRPWNG
ncbi:13928_t:CDS:2, partial [Racocetra fulgida]